MAKQKETTGTITVTLNFEDWMEGTIRNSLEERLVSQLSEKIGHAIEGVIEQRILALADAEFKKLAKAKVDDFFGKPQRKTNQWGEPVGEPVSLREIFIERFDKYLNEKVDAKSGAPSSYSSREGVTRTQFMLNSLAHKPLQDAVDETVRGIAAKAKEQIQASVSRYIAEQLAPTVNVPALKQ